MDWKDAISRRRALLIAPLAFGGLIALSSRQAPRAAATGGEIEIDEFDAAGHPLGPQRVQRLNLTDAEWRKKLTLQQFYVTRKGSTDTPFTGTYHKLHAPGMFRCIGCGTALFDAKDKYDSGTGWPSFSQPVSPKNIANHADTSLFLERTEVICIRCAAHLGHVFPDGPAPTGLRYCLNESSLKFVAYTATPRARRSTSSLS